MAGIVGMIGDNASCEQAEAMLERIPHRGPDGRHVTEGRDFVLACCEADTGSKRRRSYAGGDKEGLVFDGTIWDSAGGYQTDAELLYRQYHTFGRECFQHIDGSYAVAVANDDELLLARDRIGVRPLFYAYVKDGVCFASEVKALLDITDAPSELPPGCLFSSRRGLRRFDVIDTDVPKTGSVSKGKRMLRELLFDATRKRMIERAVGGVALSGGLDSSIIAAIALDIEPSLELYTAGLAGSPDLENAVLVAEALNARDRHHVRVVGEKEIEALVREAIWYLESFEEDCVEGCVANMLVAELAHKHTNCCLCGDGADVLFGGYQLLKRLRGKQRRETMLEALLKDAYSTGLRRLDRGWRSRSVNYRAPFLDSRVVAVARQMPVQWKIHGDPPVEKWILREAFRDLLPARVIDRTKLTPASGTSVDQVMTRIAERHISPEELEQQRVTPSGYRINSAKELWYYRIFKELFPPEAYERLVARWDPTKPAKPEDQEAKIKDQARNHQTNRAT